MIQETAIEKTAIRETAVCEMTVCETAVCEMTVCETAVCEMTVCETAVCEMAANPGMSRRRGNRAVSSRCGLTLSDRFSLIGGFTLIELMMVVAIIILAAGFMAPTITDFFKTRQLENLRGLVGGAFNQARLKAVTEGIRTSLVFFKEGVRVYDERHQVFVDEFFNPENSPLATGQAWMVFGFLGGKTSHDLTQYRRWEDGQYALRAQETREKASETRGGITGQVSTAGLPKIIFERDGSLTFGSGSDVSSALFREKIPPNSDIMIFQAGNTTGCFIDFRATGQIRSKLEPLGRIPKTPEDEEAGRGGKSKALGKGQ